MTPDSKQGIKERLSSWRYVGGGVEYSPERLGETSINEAEVRIRQRRAESMLLHLLTEHDAFYAQVQTIIETGAGGRDSNHQQRVADMAAFTLGVFEQFSAENLHQGLRNELANLPKEVIQTVTVPAPQPPKSWWQRFLGS